MKRRIDMKTFVRSVLFAGAMYVGANGLMAAPASDAWVDQWYRAKFGRPSPATEARLNAEKERTTSRDEAREEGSGKAHNRTRKGAAFREGGQAVRKSSPGEDWLDQWFRAKYGRPAPVR
jgi:hypothetical protein